MPSPSSKPLSVALLLCLALAACDRSPPAAPADDAGSTAPAGDAPADAGTPPPDNPQEPAPPATLPDGGAPASPGALPAPGTITWEGFGPADFGADQEAVRQAWGRDLGDASPDEPGGCYYLMPQPTGAAGFSVAFMIEGDRFSRIDIRTPEVEAPGGGRVGMSGTEIERLYEGRVESMPHKYEEDAQYLRIAAPEGGDSALLFETDPAGEVTEWRIGVPPQVDYVEGCA